MKRFNTVSLLLLLAFLLIVSGCSYGSDSDSKKSNKVADDKNVYSQDRDEILNVYVTVVKENTVTLQAVNAWSYSSGAPKPEIYVRFDYDRPAEDVSGVKANAVLSQRGKGSSDADLKSYKIKLDKSAETWEGQDTLNLNKHPDDITRIRNKLCYELISMFPDTFGCRTQFCHLYIRNLNSSDQGYADYGLFTHVEEVGKDYLRSRGIKTNAFLYKAVSFSFLIYPDVIKNVDDPGYSKVEFEKILEIKGVEDHSRLIQMLKDVNDETQDINDVIAKHFDRNNYVTWLALNLLLSNTDTDVGNFYLLSPSNQSKWYFMTWDYDQSLNYNYEIGYGNDDWTRAYITKGVSMYWGSPLHRRFLQDPDNVKELTAKVEELRAIATNEIVAGKVDRFYSLTNALVKSSPDSLIMNQPVSVYESEVQKLKTALDFGRETYYIGLKLPMPFELNEVNVVGGRCTFSWGKSYDIEGDRLHYELFISDSPYFEEIVLKRENLEDTTAAVSSLTPGIYYWKVEAVDPSGNRQGAFGSYYDPVEDIGFFGIKKLVLN